MAITDFLELTKQCSKPQTIRLGFNEGTPKRFCLLDGTLDLAKKLYTPELDMGLILNTPFQVDRVTSTVNGFTFAGFPVVTTTGIGIHDLSVEDPNFPATEEPNWVLINIFQLTGATSPLADQVSTEIIMGTISNGEIVNHYITRQKILAGQVDYTEETFNRWLPLNDKNQIAIGINANEPAGSFLVAEVYVVGYLKSTDLGIKN